MAIKRQFCLGSKSLHHGRPERQVRNEVAIHDVDVDNVRTESLEVLHRVAQPREAGREDRRSDLDVHCVVVAVVAVVSVSGGAAVSVCGASTGICSGSRMAVSSCWLTTTVIGSRDDTGEPGSGYWRMII